MGSDWEGPYLHRDTIEWWEADCLIQIRLVVSGAVGWPLARMGDESLPSLPHVWLAKSSESEGHSSSFFLIVRLMIFPEVDLGSSLTNSMALGYLYGAVPFLT